MKKCILFLFVFSMLPVFSQYNYNRQWGTFFEGRDIGYANLTSVVSTKKIDSKIDHQGNIVVCGVVKILENNSYYQNFTTPNAHQSSVAGGLTDLFIAKFSPQGSLIWCTYFGGEGEDNYPKVDIDSNNNIFIIGTTTSTTGIATSGSFMFSLPTIPLTKVGFMTKFNTNGNQLWGTYFPGKIDTVYISPSDEVFIGGVTASPTGISTIGAYRETLDTYVYNQGGDNTNCFINKFDTNGNRLIGTYYARRNNISIGVTDIVVNNSGEIIIGGSVDNDFFNVVASPGCHQPINGGYGYSDGYLAKFNPSLSQRIWSTFYGGNGRDGISNLTISNNAIYIFGSTASSNNISTVNSFQPNLNLSTNYSSDFFLAKFDMDGVREWGTYFGGNGLDNIIDAKIKDNYIYLTGNTSSTLGYFCTNSFQENHTSYYDQYGFPILTGFFSKLTLEGYPVWSSYYNGVTLSNILTSDFDGFYLLGEAYSYYPNDVATSGCLQPVINVGTSTTGGSNMFITRFDTLPLSNTTFSENSNFQLYPNPNKGSFSLEGTIANAISNLELNLYDNLGRKVANQEVLCIGNTLHQEFNFNVSKGIYLAELTNGKDILKSFKVVVE